MSLVPIIYTSLLVVSIFLIVVISVSYISFKARTKGQPKIKHTDEVNMFNPVYQNTQNVPAAKQYNNYPQEQYVYPDEERIYAEEQPEPERPSYYAKPNPSFGFRTEGSHNYSNIQNEENEYYENRPAPRRQSKRIQIMNDTEKYGATNTNDYTYNKPSKRVFQPANKSINEYNVLSFYDDNNNSNFSSITINK